MIETVTPVGSTVLAVFAGETRVNVMCVIPGKMTGGVGSTIGPGLILGSPGSTVVSSVEVTSVFLGTAGAGVGCASTLVEFFESDLHPLRARLKIKLKTETDIKCFFI